MTRGLHDHQKRIFLRRHKQTYRQTDGHQDAMTESAQLADSVKISDKGLLMTVHIILRWLWATKKDIVEFHTKGGINKH